MKLRLPEVDHVWTCDDDGDHDEECVTVGTTFYEQNGTPVCGVCSRDMEYSHTEIDFDSLVRGINADPRFRAALVIALSAPDTDEAAEVR